MTARPRFSDEFALIPLPAKVVAVLGPVCVIGIAFLVIFLAASGAAPGAGRPSGVAVRSLITLVIPVVLSAFFAVWILLVGYVYADSKRRRMTRWVWMLIVVFVPNLLGFLLYFLLRYPVPSDCPGCGHSLDGDVAYCPYCGRQVGRSCPQCSRSVGMSDAFCPGCGQSLQTPPG